MLDGRLRNDLRQLLRRIAVFATFHPAVHTGARSEGHVATARVVFAYS